MLEIKLFTSADVLGKWRVKCRRKSCTSTEHSGHRYTFRLGALRGCCASHGPNSVRDALDLWKKEYSYYCFQFIFKKKNT